VSHDGDDLFAKADRLAEEVKSQIQGHQQGLQIVIEEPLLRFARGMSSASTLLTLNRYNGMVTHAVWKSTGVKPTHLNVIFARRRLGIKKGKDDKVKEVVMDWVAKSLPDYQWPTRVVTRGKNRGAVIFEESCFDVADAYVMARASYESLVK